MPAVQTNNKISVYTTLIILSTMRDRLGVEAMVSFLDNYVRIIEEHHPGIREAVHEELKEKALAGLYEGIRKDE